ncbi:hypothetical protein DM02DRAFT_579570 [Periconia macrospinosa]|uniref:Nuclear envelope protein n=1 Tax=Periconia macrospinosa TaxID=97972 RepID=A0A2V1EB42_9PLEO|nr:hypothetical protein DM02DRAFT_579570 [Periconia macrospinosa]
MAAAVPPARPYRDFLTPALHKRFTDASFYTLVLCYLISVWMDDWGNYLWAWFPIGPAGIRALLLFISALVVFILRVAQWHVGQRNTERPLDTFRKYAIRKNTVLTLAGYAISAWFYCEIYIWTRAGKSRLGFTDRGGRQHDWIRLNERPLYLRFMFFTLAIVQGVCHLWYDYDTIDLPAMKPRKERNDDPEPPPKQQPSRVLIQKLKPMGLTAVLLVLTTFLLGNLLYFLGFRNILWEYYYSFAAMIVSLRRSSSPFGLPPFAPLVGMFISQGFLLVLLWQLVNTAFGIYISQPPLKKDKPVTSDSKDPNGSLLSGLKSKKDTVKAIALWELALITDRFPDRRKTIYSEIDRKTAPTSKQITDICLAEIRLLTTRINIALDPTFRPVNEDGKKQEVGPIALVSRVSQPIKDGAVTYQGPDPDRTRTAEAVQLASGLAKDLSSPKNSNLRKSPYVRNGLEYSQNFIKENTQKAEAQMEATGFWPALIKSSMGVPFRYNLHRTASLIVTGAPYSRLSPLCNAISAIANLAVLSIKEDDWGRFSDHVPDIIRAFTVALQKLDEYVDSLTVHWTDLEALSKPEEERKKTAEVEQVREGLREGLRGILGVFGEYLRAMNMAVVEIQEAKRAVARGPEMAHVR